MKTLNNRQVGFLEKFIPPIFIGLLLIVSFFIVISIWGFNVRDKLIAVPLVFILIIYFIRQKKGTDLKNGTINKIYKYLFEKTKYELAKNEYDLNTFKVENPRIVTFSKSTLTSSIIFSIIGILLGLFVLTKDLWVCGIVLLILLTINILKIIDNLYDKNPQLLISKAGIATKKIGFIEWRKIININIVDKGNDNVSNYLDIYFTDKESWTKPDESLYLDNLDISTKELEQLINIYK